MDVVARVNGCSAGEVEAVRERSERAVSQSCTHAPELSASEVEAVRERSERAVSQSCTHAPELSASEVEAV
ncbi:hypothetical protein, partial [Nocardia sp. NPDC052112]|uniref:hypothetical protein n=1 Tax=Nocardia sp. NPDC052112 TaxID=3155646 RepID=UPI0034340254